MSRAREELTVFRVDPERRDLEGPVFSGGFRFSSGESTYRRCGTGYSGLVPRGLTAKRRGHRQLTNEQSKVLPE